MIVTTDSSITVTKIVPKDTTLANTSTNTQLIVSNLGVTYIFNNPVITVPTVTVDGSITFSDVTIDEGVNTIVMSRSANDDLDTDGEIFYDGRTSANRVVSETTAIIGE